MSPTIKIMQWRLTLPPDISHDLGSAHANLTSRVVGSRCDLENDYSTDLLI